MKSLEQIKRDERSLAIANALGRLERASQAIAAAMTAGVKPSAKERRAVQQMLVELCVEYGRALNMGVA